MSSLNVSAYEKVKQEIAILERAHAESEERWRTLLDNVGDFVLLVDRDGKIESINRTRPDQPSVVGTFGREYILPEYHAIVNAARAQCFEGIRPEEVLVQTIQEGLWFSIRMAPIYEGDMVTKVLAICADTTERRKAEIALNEANELLEDRVEERTRELSVINQLLREQRERLRNLLDMQNRDRQLIAFEIHDGMVQDMTAAAMYMESFGDLLENGPAADAHRKGLGLLRDAIAEARALISGLRPPILEGEGLQAAVQSLVDEFAVRHQFTVDLEWDASILRLAPALETAIYRGIQEALHNALQHGETDRAAVVVRRQAERVNVQVSDQGCGFEVENAGKKRHGLKGIRERANVLGGASRITSHVGQGSTVELDMPLIDALSPE
ncbi:PAS domain-containing sensor histidine kinase [Lignipirellula cremea]|uniref:histidine kinase n=1 Tax=Lignipirellula cremea TaxID=2528010 RepID=A0A518DLH5_9BACT|nr:PAS domain-containing sensor histidine kinase [Lignipirellula cremea]QDU92687.1 Sensor histidine kinase LiaS [Lignipirellula cremea]